ncbi:MAG TPA: radical SAM/SPASM domain-containing protein [Candidatus Hydrogenedentes bacterium]|nr:radical SAM/SPASM domain-containing protein [Candidatus Hydrogenedentota bacterium]HPG68192.1 radical SAM/SPASM domain-containing protein [Candidatus Hydrogenedentota bacterium]
MGFREATLRSTYWLVSKLLYGGVQADWLYERMQRPVTCFYAALDLLHYLARRPRMPFLISLTVEPVFGCNLRCSYCGLALESRVKSRPALMPWETFRKVINETPRSVESVSFSLLGEPLRHPQIGDMVDYTATGGFRPIVFTNGVLLTGKVIERLARTPLDVLNVSVEPDEESQREFRGADLEVVRENLRQFVAIKRPETQVKLSLVAHAGNADRMSRVWQTWSGLIDHIKVSPRIYLAPPHASPMCLEPWRGNLNIRTDGAVSPCCFDVFGHLDIGNVNEQDLPAILRGSAYRDLLTHLTRREAPRYCCECTQFRAPGVPLRAPKGKGCE